MKVLSLKQPWAELILQGKKKIELRKWNTHFRGEFLIHSSKISDEKNMKRFKFEGLPSGFIIGKAEITGIKNYSNNNEFFKDKNKHLATKHWGKYGFILKNVRRVKPIPAKGKLGFWELENGIYS